MDGMTRDGYLKIISSIVSEVIGEIKADKINSGTAALARFEQLLKIRIPEYVSYYPTTPNRSPTESEKEKTNFHNQIELELRKIEESTKITAEDLAIIVS